MTSEYDSVDEMWTAMIQDVLLHGKNVDSRAGASREIIGWSGKLRDVQKNFLCNEVRAADPRYACAELLWYLSRSNDTTMLQAYAPSYKNYTEDGRIAYGAYGHRIANNIKDCDQLFAAIERLKDHNTRQCVVSLWKPDDLTARAKDMPCTLTWQFLLRDNALHMVTSMRSNDIWLGAPYDVFCFACVQMLVAGTLGCKLGTYTHNVGSLHLYDKALLRCARQALEQPAATIAHGWRISSSISHCKDAVLLEYLVRNGYGDEHFCESYYSSKLGGEVSMLSDAVRCCNAKHEHVDWEPNLVSSSLRKGLEIKTCS